MDAGKVRIWHCMIFLYKIHKKAAEARASFCEAYGRQWNVNNKRMVWKVSQRSVQVWEMHLKPANQRKLKIHNCQKAVG